MLHSGIYGLVIDKSKCRTNLWPTDYSIGCVYLIHGNKHLLLQGYGLVHRPKTSPAFRLVNDNSPLSKLRQGLRPGLRQVYY